jgi:hypothetical protein
MVGKVIGASVLLATVTAMGMKSGIDSGLKIGEFVPAFHPNHVTGPHKGTDTCPPCTYGKLPQVQVWVNGDDAKNVEAIASLLDKRVGTWHKSDLKAFFIFVTDGKNQAATKKRIEDVATRSGAKIAMAWIDKGNESVEEYAINTDTIVKNTILLYKDMVIVKKFVNLTADAKGLSDLGSAVDSITK